MAQNEENQALIEQLDKLTVKARTKAFVSILKKSIESSKLTNPETAEFLLKLVDSKQFKIRVKDILTESGTQGLMDELDKVNASDPYSVLKFTAGEVAYNNAIAELDAAETPVITEDYEQYLFDSLLNADD